MKKNFPTLILLGLFGLSSLLFFSCAPTDPDPDPTEDPVINGYVTDEIDHTHRVGKDPCPQSIVDKAKVFCYKAAKFTECDADSVVITNPSTGLTAKFEGTGTASTKLAGSEGEFKSIVFTFTCAIAKSFVHKYKLVFYKDGKEVDSEEITMNITVIQ